MYVDNQEVKPVDPCFATPGMLGYEDSSMNNLKVSDDHYHEMTSEIKDSEGNIHEIQIRWSRLPALFFIRNNSDEPDVEKAFIKGKYYLNQSQRDL